MADGWDGRGLVSTAWLADHLREPRLRIFDVTTHLRPSHSGAIIVESGRADYVAGHVPGAAFLNLARDFSDRGSRFNFTMPPLDAFARALGAAGVTVGSPIVLYSSTTPMWATRFWWMLRACGLDDAAVLNGGLAKWRREGRAIERGLNAYPAGAVSLTPRPGLWADKAMVLTAIGRPGICTINALPADDHLGRNAVPYARPGRIAGSRNAPYASLLNPDGTFRQDSDLRALFEPLGAFQCDQVIVYCGGGIAATASALALSRLGHPSIAVYDGSLAEWSRDASLPMQLG